MEEFKWGCGFVVEPESLIDGLFFPRSQYWDEGAVWWDTNDGRERWIELDLGGDLHHRRRHRASRRQRLLPAVLP